MRKLYTIFAVLLLSICATPIFAGDKVKARLDNCVDGDTAWLYVSGGGRTKFRFLGIDAPDSGDKYYSDASKYTCNMLTRATAIEVEYDDNSDISDTYGRTLAWIWVDGDLLQERLVANGLASVGYIYGDYMYTLNLCYTQSTAIKEKKNLWSDSSMTEGYCSTVNYSNSSSVSSSLSASSTVSTDKSILDRISDFFQTIVDNVKNWWNEFRNNLPFVL